MLQIVGDDHNRDFFFEMQKHSMHLRTEFFSRQLAIYELYKKTMDLPGSVVEFGVRNGANFFFLSRLLEVFHPAQRHDGISSRHIYGFDTFSGFPQISREDQAPTSWHEMHEGGISGDRDIFFHDFKRFKEQSPIASRLHIIEGDVMETWSVFLQEQPGVRFSFVYFDLDIYAPTKFLLETIWDKCVPGAIVVFDEFGLKEFPGESLAADEFFQEKNVQYRSIQWCYCPSMYVVKH